MFPVSGDKNVFLLLHRGHFHMGVLFSGKEGHIVSPVPLTQNNLYAKVSYLEVTCSELLPTICNSEWIMHLNVGAKAVPLQKENRKSL